MATLPFDPMALAAQAPQLSPRPTDPAEAEMVFSQMRQSVSPKEFSDELLSGAEQVDPKAVAELRNALDELDVPPEILDLLNQLVDEILANPQNYEQIKDKYRAQGVTDDILPEQFDPEFFAALNVAVDQLRGEPAGPQAFAQGGIAELKPIAKAMASYGRNGDTMLAHITPAEARMLRRHGGSGTINPVTGLPEFFLGKLFKSIGNAVKKFASSTVGRIVTTVALGFLVGPAAASMLGVSSAAGVAAVSGFVGSAGSTLLGGGNLRDALKAGATSALVAGVGAGVMGGADSFQAGSYQGPTTISGQFDRAVKAFTPGAEAATPAATPAAPAAAGTAPAAPAASSPYNLSGKMNFGPGTVPGAPGTMDLGMGTQPMSPADMASVRESLYRTPEFARSAAGAAAPTAPSSTASSPAAGTAPGAIAPPTKIPTIGEGFSRVMSGDITGGLKDIFTPGGLTPQQITETTEFKQLVARGFSPSEALKVATNQVNPGVLRTYGPMAAAGLGIMGLAGGFKQQPVTSPYSDLFTGGPGSAADLLRKNPGQYYVQGLPGVTYYGGSVLPPPPPKLAHGGEVQRFSEGGELTPVIPKIEDEIAKQTPAITPGPQVANMPTTSQIGTRPGPAEVSTAAVGGYNMYSPAAQNMYYNELNRSLLSSPQTSSPSPLVFPSNEKLAGIEQAYRELLGRDPDVRGLMSYANPQAGLSVEDVRKSLMATPEREQYLRNTRRDVPTPTVPIDRRVTLNTPKTTVDGDTGGTVDMAVVVYGPDGTLYSSPAAARAAGVTNYTTSPPAMGGSFQSSLPPRFGGGPRLNDQQYSQLMASGGIASLAGNGYPRRTGQISGPGTETSDSIPAMLSDGEFVMTAKAVRGAGKGSRRAGAKKLYALMHQLERNASRG